LQRPFHKGFSFLLTYAYVKSKTQWYYDDQDEYDDVLTWYDFSSTQSGGAGAAAVTTDSPHNFVLAATVEIPVGRGRSLGNEMSSALDAIIGGWQISGMYRYNSGRVLVFTDEATAPTATPNLLKEQGPNVTWFDTTGFSGAEPNTRRSNPWYYDGLTGPSYSNLDLGLTKRFRLSERIKLEVRLDAFNALNGMNWQDPSLSATSSSFGIVNTQVRGYAGRQLQYSARLEF
jgi:hypothetical protein